MRKMNAKKWVVILLLAAVSSFACLIIEDNSAFADKIYEIAESVIDSENDADENAGDDNGVDESPTADGAVADSDFTENTAAVHTTAGTAIAVNTVVDNRDEQAAAEAINTVDLLLPYEEELITDELYVIEGLKNFPIIHKSFNQNRYEAYCLNMDITYSENILYEQQYELENGFAIILKNRPHTDNPDLDFYITQLAVWYYIDLMNNDNHQLSADVKQYIIKHKDTDYICKEVMRLYNHAKRFHGMIEIEPVYAYTSVGGEYQPLLIDFNSVYETL